MGYRGYLDLVRQSHVAGWAGDENGPVLVSIVINDKRVAETGLNSVRKDLEPFGYPEKSGFIYHFEEPLDVNDTVSVLFPDGSHLTNSPSIDHHTRLNEILHGIDLAGGGLELGPLDKPLLSKKRTNVLYVDHASKKDLLSKYAGTPEEIIAAHQIPETDIIWPGGELVAVCPPGSQFDYCVASHAIEHVPDMVGWIRGICRVLKVGGMLNLAVPDKTRSFDRLRRLTSTSEFVSDFIEKRTRPSARHIFDALAYVSPLHENDRRNLKQGLDAALMTEANGKYLDVHCHVFTLRSFLLVFADLAEMGLIQLELVKAFPCRPGNNEFVVALRKCNAHPVAAAASFTAAAMALD
jgi:hypothetical protein